MTQDLYDNDDQQQAQQSAATSDISGTGGHAIGMTEDNPQQLEEAVVMPGPKLEFPEETPEKPEKPDIEPYSLPDGRNLVDYLEGEARKAKAAAPTPEELRREARHRRTSKIIAGIGDAASSIANLFATIHYAPSAKRPQKSLGEHLQGVYDRIDASRKEQEKYLRGLQEKLATAKDALINGRYNRAKDALGEYHKDVADYNKEMENYNRQVGNVLKQRHNEVMEGIARDRVEETKRHNGTSEDIIRIKANKTGGGRKGGSGTRGGGSGSKGGGKGSGGKKDKYTAKGLFGETYTTYDTSPEGIRKANKAVGN